jgi:hypothetical protein
LVCDYDINGDRLDQAQDLLKIRIEIFPVSLSVVVCSFVLQSGINNTVKKKPTKTTLVY